MGGCVQSMSSVFGGFHLLLVVVWSVDVCPSKVQSLQITIQEFGCLLYEEPSENQKSASYFTAGVFLAVFDDCTG